MAEIDEQKKNKLPLSVKFAILCVIGMAALFFPTTVLFVGCMVPTFVAAIVDNNQQKTAWLTVGCMNFAGVVPAWFLLWERGHHLDQSFNLLLQSSTLIVAYGAAGIGWILYYNITPFVAGILIMRSEKRLKDIDKRQKDLISKWGQEITGN